MHQYTIINLEGCTMKKHASKAPVKSESYDPKFFTDKREYTGNVQTTNVTVHIEEKDDGIAECISGCFRMCAGAAKSAAK